MVQPDIKKVFVITERMRILLLISTAGLLLNIAGKLLFSSIGSPFYFDTAGTMLVSAMTGYLPGIIVGFLTNVITSLNNFSDISYGFINIMAGVFTVILAQKKVFESLLKTLLAIPVYAVFSGVSSALVAWLLGESEKIEILHDILIELGDKGITVAVVFAVLKFVPQKYRISKNNPLFEKNDFSIAGLTSRVMSIRTKLLIMLTFVCLSIAGIITAVSFLQFRETTIDEHVRSAKSILEVIAGEINADKISDYIENGYDEEGYIETEQRLYQIRDSYSDIKYLYVYRMTDEYMQVVFDLDSENLEADPPGEIIDYYAEFIPLISDFASGKEVEPSISKDAYGYHFLLSVYKPIFDSNGEYQCHIGVDYSMSILENYNRIFIVKVITMFCGFVVLVFAVAITVMEKNIIIPVNDMAYCAGTFAYNSEEERLGNVKRIQNLNIRTGDEIENLYNAFLKTTEDSMKYVENLRKAENQVHDMEEQVSQISATAYRDALTGVKNKASYNKYKEMLERSIQEGNAEFAVVMVDLNNLKKVNDTYGHENGDTYIKGACHIICNIYKHSPVFRIGGDEFVIILTGNSYQERSELLEELTSTFNKIYADESLNPWDRYSGAVGMAEYTGTEEDVDTVFKRADKSMYENKVKMKMNRTE